MGIYKLVQIFYIINHLSEEYKQKSTDLSPSQLKFLFTNPITDS